MGQSSKNFKLNPTSNLLPSVLVGIQKFYQQTPYLSHLFPRKTFYRPFCRMDPICTSNENLFLPYNYWNRWRPIDLKWKVRVRVNHYLEGNSVWEWSINFFFSDSDRFRKPWKPIKHISCMIGSPGYGERYLSVYYLINYLSTYLLSTGSMISFECVIHNTRVTYQLICLSNFPIY